MENIEFYAYPTENSKPLEVLVQVDQQRPFLVSSSDREQLDRDWKERGYTRSSPVGTLWEASFHPHTGETQLTYLLTEYKVYSGIAFPALPDTEQKVSHHLKDRMRISANGCVVETSDGKILAQRRREGIISSGMIDSGAAGIMVYDHSAGVLDWKRQAEEKLARELNLVGASHLGSLIPTAVFSSRGPAHVPAAKGYFTGCYSGMVSSLVRVNLSYDAVLRIFNQKEVGDIMGIEKSDLSAFLLEHSQPGNRSRGLVGDGCAALLSVLPATEFQETVDRLNSRDSCRIRFGFLQEGKFIEQ